MPVGLIINELVTNSFKYAFSKTEGPMLKISCKCEGDHIEIIFKDNGPGRGSNPGDGLGMEIIESLTEQLDGTFEQFDDNGLVSVLKFQLN